MTKYTVIGYYEDNQQTFIESAKTTSANKAIHKVCKRLAKINGWDGIDNMCIVAVLIGTCVWASDWDTPSVCSALDVPRR